MTGSYNYAWNTHVPRQYESPNILVIRAAKSSIKMVLGLDFEQYNTKIRQRPLCFARECFTYLVKKNSMLSLRAVGALYKKGYDHSSIINQCLNIENLEFMGRRDDRNKDWEQIKENFKIMINNK